MSGADSAPANPSRTTATTSTNCVTRWAWNVGRAPDRTHGAVRSVGQCGGVHGLAVEVGTVEAGDIDEVEFVLVAMDFGVQAADGEVVEVRCRCAGGDRGGNRLVQREPQSDVGVAFDDERGASGRQPVYVARLGRGGCAGFADSVRIPVVGPRPGPSASGRVSMRWCAVSSRRS